MCSNVGDEHGLLSVIKFEAEERQLLKSSYHLSAKFLRGNFLLSLVSHKLSNILLFSSLKLFKLLQ